VFWGGGTVALATSEDNFHVLKCKPSDRLEDGTVAFLDIIAVKHGLASVQRLGGIRAIQAHVASLTEWLYTRLSRLQHSTGQPMLAIFGKHHLPNHRSVQGGIINFELLRPDGSIFSYKTFEREAAAAGFHVSGRAERRGCDRAWGSGRAAGRELASLVWGAGADGPPCAFSCGGPLRLPQVRTGAECNPGACYNYLGVKEAEVESLAGKKEGCEDDVEFITVQRPVANEKASRAGRGGGGVERRWRA
jgi:molybdenum cofactor sulfurtransferase